MKFLQGKFKLNMRILTMIFIVVSVLFIFSCAFSPILSVADAVSPENYQQNVIDNDLDWYMGENYLNIARVREIVSTWFSNDNFNFVGIKPVVVAVIDTGVNLDHEIFTGKYDENGKPVDSDGVGEYDVFYRDSDGNIIGVNTAVQDNKNYTSTNFYDDDPKTTNTTAGYHGTHVAGIIAALIHELNLEEYIKIMPIKASYVKNNKSSFSKGAVDDAIDFAMDNGADVVNMSFSSNEYAYGSTITDEMAKKTVFVAAAGNDSSHIKRYPAAHKNVIGVMNYTKSTDEEPIKATKTNYGDWFDIFAPGTTIQSADGSTSDSYKLMNGTSMASPMVAFAAALTTLKCRAISNVSGESFDAMNIVEAVMSSNKTISVPIGSSKLDFSVLDLISLTSGEEVMFARIKVLEGSLEQLIGDVHPITLSLTIYPYDNVDVGNVEWFVDDKLVSTNKQFIYTPQNTVTVTPTKIHAIWTFSEGGRQQQRVATVYVNVGYYVLDIPAIKQLNIAIQDEDGNSALRDSYRQEEILRLHFDNFDANNISPNTTILWYINGEVVGVGAEIYHQFEDKGEYEVMAKINGIYTNSITIVVDRIEEGREDAIVISTSTAVACIVIGALTSISIVISRKRRLAKTSQEYTKESVDDID